MKTFQSQSQPDWLSRVCAVRSVLAQFLIHNQPNFDLAKLKSFAYFNVSEWEIMRQRRIAEVEKMENFVGKTENVFALIYWRTFSALHKFSLSLPPSASLFKAACSHTQLSHHWWDIDFRDWRLTSLVSTFQKDVCSYFCKYWMFSHTHTQPPKFVWHFFNLFNLDEIRRTLKLRKFTIQLLDEIKWNEERKC